jgi:hypothetical protein
MIAVAMPLLGYRFQVVMLMPAALSQLALILWLLAKGFNERPVRSIDALK